MNDQLAYLQTEMRRYHPDAVSIKAAWDNDDETWTITLTYTDSDPQQWTMEVGSDDSWYTFTHGEGYENTITFPYDGKL